MFFDVDKTEICEIIKDNTRFISPYTDPYGYYIYLEDESNKEPEKKEITETYLSKLKYATKNMDILTNEAYNMFWQKFGNKLPNSLRMAASQRKPAIYARDNIDSATYSHHLEKNKSSCYNWLNQMWKKLIFESFVYAVDREEIAGCLSNPEFLSGHYIECRWDLNWNLVFIGYC